MSIVKKKDKAKIDYRTLTSKEVEEELKRITYNTSYIKVLKSTVYALIIIAAIAVLIATFFNTFVYIFLFWHKIFLKVMDMSKILTYFVTAKKFKHKYNII